MFYFCLHTCTTGKNYHPQYKTAAVNINVQPRHVCPSWSDFILWHFTWLYETYLLKYLGAVASNEAMFAINLNTKLPPKITLWVFYLVLFSLQLWTFKKAWRAAGIFGFLKRRSGLLPRVYEYKLSSPWLKIEAGGSSSAIFTTNVRCTLKMLHAMHMNIQFGNFTTPLLAPTHTIFNKS